MITLEKVRADYYFFSGKLSDVVRQLNLAGIGVIWILRIGKDAGDFKFDPQMKGSLSAFCLALMLDLFQYVFSTAIWGIYGRYKEKRGALPETVLHPSKYMNWPAIGCLWGKTFMSVAGLWTLLRYLGRQF